MGIGNPEAAPNLEHFSMIRGESPYDLARRDAVRAAAPEPMTRTSGLT